MTDSIITPTVAEEVVRQWNLGIPSRKIAADLRIGIGALEHYCSKNRDRCQKRSGFGRVRTWVPTGPTRDTPAITDRAALDAEIIRLYPTTDSVTIAERLGCSEYDVRRTARKCRVVKTYTMSVRRSTHRLAVEAAYRARMRGTTIDCSAHLKEMDAAAEASDLLLEALKANHAYGTGELDIRSSGAARYVPHGGMDRSYVGSSAASCADSPGQL